MNTNCQRQEVHIGNIFRWCIAKIFKINFTIQGIWLNIQIKHHAPKGFLVAPIIVKQSCKAMIRVTRSKRLPTYDIYKYI
jgi:hypothetical protein